MTSTASELLPPTVRVAPIMAESPAGDARAATMTAVQPARISVIMPLYNKAPFVEKAIRSALGNGPGVIEVIVVDDGSSDNGVEIVEAIQDPRIRLVSKTNGGVSTARNVGLDLARGDWLAFLDADDYWLPGYIDAVQTMIARFPQCGMVTTRYQFEDDDGNRTSVGVEWPFDEQAGTPTGEQVGQAARDQVDERAGKGAGDRASERVIAGARDEASSEMSGEASAGASDGAEVTSSDTDSPVLVEDFYGAMSLGHFCFTCSVVIRRDIIRREGLRFPVGEQMGEDLEVIFSAAEAAPVAVDSRELVVYRDSNQGLRLSRGRLDNLLLPFFQRLVQRLESGQMPDSMRAGAESYLRSHMKYLVTYAARHNRRPEGFRLIRHRLISRHPDTLVKALITLLLPLSLVEFLKARLK